MSARVAPEKRQTPNLLDAMLLYPTPVANGGLPRNPDKKRKTQNPVKFLTYTVAICSTQNRDKVMIYGGVRPIDGISEMGERMSGPTAYPRTNKDTPNVEAVIDTPNCSAPIEMAGAHMEDPM